MAEQCGLGAGDFVWTGGDCHLYLNHTGQARLQLSREPFPPPRLRLRRRPATIFEYEFADFELEGYPSHPRIAAPVAV